MNLTKYERRPSREVRIGRVVIGGDRPIAVQSMTNTDTKDTEACIRQIERIFRAGGPIVRLTAQGRREGENLERIVRRLREEGCDAAVVADIHFVPEVAAIAAKYVDKVRINPGNYNSSHGEFEALIDRCRERGVAIRIGVNHGSLSKRVFDEWGDTPEGMVASAMEFLRVCREKGVRSGRGVDEVEQYAGHGGRLPASGGSDGAGGGWIIRSTWASPKRETGSKDASRALSVSERFWRTVSATRSAFR